MALTSQYDTPRRSWCHLVVVICYRALDQLAGNARSKKGPRFLLARVVLHRFGPILILLAVCVALGFVCSGHAISGSEEGDAVGDALFPDLRPNEGQQHVVRSGESPYPCYLVLVFSSPKYFIYVALI